MRRKVDNIVEYFNTRIREDYWVKVSDFKKEQLEDFLEDAKRVLIDKYGEYDTNGVCLVETDESGISMRAKPYFRLLVGYEIFGYAGIKSGLYTEDSLSKETTDDHLIGAQKIGETVFIAYCKSGFDNEYMKNVWLYENLYLWLSIKVTKDEHNNNISKKQIFTIKDKSLLKHYDGVSDIFYNLKEIVYYKIKDGIDVEKSLSSMRKSKRKEFFSTMVVGESIIQDKENRSIMNDLSKDGLVVKYSEYV